MKTLLTLLCLALAAGAQTITFRTDKDVNRGCYRAGVREGWKCIGGARLQAWMLMPIVEPLPPPHFHTEPVPPFYVQDVPAILSSCKHKASCSWEQALYPYWTCADKSRVLLTDESGARHCVKFGGAQ